MTATAEPPVREQHRRDGLPAGTTTLFVLLMAAVLATTSTVFFGFNYSMSQVHWSATTWMTLGLSLVIAGAGVHYLLHPWWMRRRAALVELSEEDSPELLGELRGLCEVAGVARPRFMLAPYATETPGGQAFGRLGDRMVRIDAGLVALRGLSAPAFRAIVLHELAHLRNRDVDLTYWTVAIWRSFVVVATLPMAWQVVTDLGTWWHDVRVVLSLTVLTSLILLTRNAVLRSRELHADARLAGWDDTEAAQALHRAVERQAGRSDRATVLKRAWDDHPHPRRRLEVLDDRTLLAGPRSWELFALGVLAPTLLGNFYALLGSALKGIPALAPFLVIIPVSAALAGAVTLSVVGTGKSRRLLVVPLVLCGGYLVGEATSLVNNAGSTFALFGEWEGAAPRTVAAAIGSLVVMFGLLVVWAASSATALEEAGRGVRGVVAVVSAVGAVALVPWLTIWWTLRSDPAMTLSSVGGRGGPAMPPGPLSVYDDVVSVVLDLSTFLRDSVFLRGSVYVPGVVLGLVLLWLVPLVIACGAKANPIAAAVRRDVWRVLALSVAAGALCLVLYGLNLLVPLPGAAALDTATLAAQLVVALVIPLVTTQLRPPLVLMGVTLVATVSAVVAWTLVGVGPCDGCDDSTLASIAVYWHHKIVFGAVVAVPVLLVVVALMTLARVAPRPAPETPAGRLGPIPLAGSSTLVLCLLVASVLPGAGNWTQFEPVVTTRECLIGTWREVEGHRTTTLRGTPVPITTKGQVWTVNADGTARQDFAPGAVHTGVYEGQEISLAFTGTASFRYEMEDDKIHLRATSISGTQTVRIGSRPEQTRPLDQVMSPMSSLSTQCDKDQLIVSDGNWKQTFARARN
ncbi:M56 family metallopeptidase [Lentzea cavernae]|uniref:Peptidase M48 domain-containing protein n=1 Tax=Lentzea cavernae TaxID=2020703 RepID=A0ABQ3MEP2_9PSEU|nr:M56 family metallopeptidase [Lentzea cavernae]GHH42657.1 hypothetical protein GCM10017774_39380 [Lentzea cavernae]